jgi:hypothetical protein
VYFVAPKLVVALHVRMVSKVAHVQDIAPIDLEQQQHRSLEEDTHRRTLDARIHSTSKWVRLLRKGSLANVIMVAYGAVIGRE